MLAFISARRVHQALCEECQQSSVRGLVGGVCDVDSGFDHLQLLRRVSGDPNETAVAGQSGANERRPRSALLGQFCPFGQGRQSLWITGAVLGLAKTDEQIGSFRVGTTACGGVVERLAIPTRCLVGCLFFEGMITSCQCPSRAQLVVRGTGHQAVGEAKGARCGTALDQ